MILSILVVGSLNMDTTLSVDHLPQPGETILADMLKTSRGGKGQNQAVAMSRLGSTVRMIGAVGKDEKGCDILKGLESEGVDVNGIIITDSPTGMASIYLDSKGNNSIVVYPGANFAIRPNDIKRNLEMFENIRYCVMQLETPLEVVYKTLEICKEKNIITVLNPAPANIDFDDKYLNLIDYLIPNETELSLLTGEELSESNMSLLASKLLQKGCKNVLITLGKEGSLLVNGSVEIKVESEEVEAIDTTAAGDSYIGGLVSSLANGYRIEEAMKFATKVAAITVTREGAIDSLPFKNEVK
ncbi:ribokinase [Microaceticoccus formicicus]|uniref:ribokinase n=1 Tax=Microaceticoccus formicicus TaxID=3118105 RepID=UPI003CD02E82|nr:ribokinase [Peptoniphilaceae bacterium AMB_02]